MTVNVKFVDNNVKFVDNNVKFVDNSDVKCGMRWYYYIIINN